MPDATSMLMQPRGFLGLKFMEMYLPMQLTWSLPKESSWWWRKIWDSYLMH